MARHRNTEWNLPEGTPKPNGGSSHSWESIHAALLMDIRDELRELNELLNCTRFITLPRTLTRIDRRLAKQIPLTPPRGNKQ